MSDPLPPAKPQGNDREVFSQRTALLLCPDEVEAQELEFQLSALLGLNILVVRSPEDAQTILASTPVDLVVVDVVAADPNPFLLCKIVKSDEKLWSIPVVAILAARDGAHRAQALNMGADDFLVRPLDSSEVYSRLRAQLRLRELHLQVMSDERTRVLIEMAGAAAHELAQPVTGAMGIIEVILDKKERYKEIDIDRDLQLLLECLQRSAEVIHKIQRIRKYATTSYAGAGNIIDINKASGSE